MHSGNAKRLRLDNLVSFMLQELGVIHSFDRIVHVRIVFHGWISDMRQCEKNDTIMSMFVLFSRRFDHFKSLAFFLKWGDRPYTKAIKHGILVKF